MSVNRRKKSTFKGNTLIWSKGTGGKKYKVVIYKKDGSKKTVQFGAVGYQQYKDRTPLKLYSKKDHLDRTRRKNYRARHGAQGYHKRVFSPAWFSWKYLW
jgi:hypothetical protein